MLVGDDEQMEALLRRRDLHAVVEAPRAVQSTDLPDDTLPIPTPQSSVLGGVVQQPREIKHGRRAGGVVRFHENSWLFFNPVSYELVKPSAGVLRETPTAELELRAIQQRSSAVAEMPQAATMMMMVPAPPPLVQSLTPIRARYMAPIGGASSSLGQIAGRPSPRLHIKAKMVEVPEGIRTAGPSIHIPNTASTPAIPQHHEDDGGILQSGQQADEHMIDLLPKSQLFVPQVGAGLPTNISQKHHLQQHRRLNARRVEGQRVDPHTDMAAGSSSPPQHTSSEMHDEKDHARPLPLESTAEGHPQHHRGSEDSSPSSTTRRTSEVNIEELISALSIDFGGDLTRADGPTQFDVMQQLTLNCMKAILKDVPFINNERLPEEEDLNVVVNLRRQYLNLHPLTSMCVAASVPNELFNKVTRSASGVPVQLEHEGFVSVKGPAAPMRALDAVTIKTTGSAHQHTAPRDLPSRKALLEQLRAAQRRAEEFFGIFATYTRIPPPLVDDVEFEVELKFDPAKLFTTNAQIVAPVNLTAARSMY